MTVTVASHQPPAQRAITTGLLSLLDESDPRLKAAALEKLSSIADVAWPQIADALPILETLYEDPSFSQRTLAALIASKTYYHLEQYTEAMEYALGSGSLFRSQEPSEFMRTLTGKLVDSYVASRKEGAMVDSRLDSFMEDLFNASLTTNEGRLGLGIALESGRLDWVRRFIVESEDMSAMLGFILKNLGDFLPDKSKRAEVLKLLLGVYTHTPADKSRDWSGLAQCFFLLEEAAEIAGLIRQLLTFEDDPHWGWLVAYQVAFDIADNEDQRINSETAIFLANVEEPVDVIQNIRDILSGKVQTRLNMEFLYRNNKTDTVILDALKSETRAAVAHNGVVLAHGLMQAGTASDSFLRNNLEWLAKAQQWAKFAATASLGVVHKGHVKESRSILSTYLPPEGAGARRSPFSEGGALFALGMVHSNQADPDAKQYLSNQLESAKEQEVLQVGASLGLGMTCLGTRDHALYEKLKSTLHCDNAVAGEAAGLAIGCVMAGSGDESVVNDLLDYARDTQHEKISRACCVGIALVSYRQEQGADGVIERMLADSDPTVRYGGAFCLGMAYCGTAQNDTIRRLLHFAVSDASDDVRRAAVISLAFVLAGEPHQLPKVLKLLAESYNPHVRYAVCLAIGIGCSGRAASMPEAMDLLEPLTKDVVEFVRQGAFIGLGLLGQQVSDKQLDGKVAKLRSLMVKTANPQSNLIPESSKETATPPQGRVAFEDPLVRFGAEIGLGLLDISGRNAVTCFFSRSGKLRLASAVGFCLFAQSWFNFYSVLCVSRAVSPTACVALNERLKMPRQFAAKTKSSVASLYGYPEALKVAEKQETKKAQTVVLSSAQKLKKIPSSTILAPMDTESEIKKPKPETMILFNPFRVVEGQEKSIELFKAGELQPIKGSNKEKSPGRYVPVSNRRSGWVIVQDTRPNEPEDLLDFDEATAPVVAPPQQQPRPETEVVPPEEFEWNE